MGEFRHTFNTWGRTVGTLIKFRERAGDRPREDGCDPRARPEDEQDHYDESVPEMCKVPIKLVHPEDPK